MKFIQEELYAFKGVAQGILGILLIVPFLLIMMVRLKWTMLFLSLAGIVVWIGIYQPPTNSLVGMGEGAGVILFLYCAWRAAERNKSNITSIFAPYKSDEECE